MGLIYTAVFSAIAVTAQQDLFEIVAPADAVVKIHSIHLNQSTEAGDSEEEQLNIQIVRGEGSVTSGSGGGTVTPAARESGFPAAGSTVERNNTTKMVVGTGTLTILEEHAWNVRVPFDLVYTPETQIVISPSDRVTVELNTTPADSITMNGTMIFEEIGG